MCRVVCFPLLYGLIKLPVSVSCGAVTYGTYRGGVGPVAAGRLQRAVVFFSSVLLNPYTSLLWNSGCIFSWKEKKILQSIKANPQSLQGERSWIIIIIIIFVSRATHCAPSLPARVLFVSSAFEQFHTSQLFFDGESFVFSLGVFCHVVRTVLDLFIFFLQHCIDIDSCATLLFGPTLSGIFSSLSI